MKNQFIAVAAVALFSGHAKALPVEAIHSLFAKILKNGASKEAVIAGRAAEATGAKGVEHLVAADAARAGSALALVEPKPDLTAEIVAKTLGEANTYRSLRASAAKGDASAMLTMSEMIASGRVSDPGEPWRGYWMFQAARLGSQIAARNARDECFSGESRRSAERWFDSACQSSDGRNLYVGDKLPDTPLPKRQDALTDPQGKAGIRK